MPRFTVFRFSALRTPVTLHSPCLSRPQTSRYACIHFYIRCLLIIGEITQRRLELEGAPDPFPSLVENVPAAPAPASNGRVDTTSTEAFPSLAPSVPAKAPTSGWGAAPRIKATVSKQPLISESFTIPAVDLSNAGRDGKPTSLGEVMRQILAQHKVRIEASTNQKSRQTTFFLKSESQKELDKAKRTLLAQLSPVVRN